MPVAMKKESAQGSPYASADVPSTQLACRDCGQVFVIFLDPDTSSLKARIWLEAKLKDDHDANRHQHRFVYTMPALGKMG